MTTIAVAPFIMKDALLKIAADNYEAHVSSVKIEPSSSPVKWKGLTPTSSYTFPTTSEWTATLAYAQDWDTADSLARYLFENEGETVAAEFTPENGGQGFAVDLVIVPGTIGGDVDTVAVGQVQLGVSGRPEYLVVGP